MKNLLKIGAVCTASVFGLAACGEGDNGFQPPKVGTQLNWTYKSDDGIEKDIYTVVAKGPDFVIFRYEVEGETEYSAEFSGIGFAGCGYGEMPARLERAKLFSAWPPNPGDVFRFNGSDIIVVNAPSSELNVMDEAVFWFEEKNEDFTEEDGMNDSKLASSLEHGTVIEIDWGNGDHDWVVSIEQPETDVFEIQPGYETIVGLNVTQLGDCAALLSEAEPITVLETTK